MNENAENKCLIFGIGNYGRQDDGLGWEFLDGLNESKFKNVSLEYRYQLQIEDAELMGGFDMVIFVDASKNKLENGFSWQPCARSNTHSFSTHALVPETILYLAEQLYHHKPKAYVLAIQGYQWELENGLSKNAQENLNKARAYFTNRILDRILNDAQPKLP